MKSSGDRSEIEICKRRKMYIAFSIVNIRERLQNKLSCFDSADCAFDGMSLKVKERRNKQIKYIQIDMNIHTASVFFRAPFFLSST